MKHTAIALGLLVSFSSFAVQINGFEITGLPTASKSYSRIVTDRSELSAAEASVKKSCLEGKASAEAFTQDKGFSIVSSAGCKVSVQNESSDMVGDRYTVSAKFEVLFK